MKRLLGVLMALLVVLSSHAQDYKAKYKAVDEFARKYGAGYFYGNINSRAIANSNSFIYSVNTPTGTEFYVVNGETGEKKSAFDKNAMAKELSAKTGKEVKVGSWPFRDVTAENETTLSFVVGDKQYTWDTKSNKITGEKAFEGRRGPGNAGGYWGSVRRGNERAEGIPSPDGKYVAFVRDNNVWVREVETKKETQMSFDGNPGEYYQPWVQWSPDSKKFVANRFFPAWTRQLTMVQSSPSDQLQPKIETYDYRKPGDALDIRYVALFTIDGMKKIEVKFDEPQMQYSIGGARWSKDGSYFTFNYNKRGHQRYVVYKVDGTTGECKPLVDEKSNTFIYYNMVYSHFLNDNEMLWISERDGWKHLYLYDVEKCAVKRQLTKGEFVVKDVISVDNEARVAYLTIVGKDAGEDPYLEKVYKLNIDKRELICLTPDNGNHKVVFNHDKSYLTDFYSRPDCPPVFAIRCGKTGKLIAELEKADVSKALEMGWQMPENFCAKGRDGVTDIWGTIVRPANFDPNKKYPIIEYIYAGPHDNHVPKDFSIAPFYYSNLVELGFIVVAIDGMGTYNRSKAFHDVCWKNIKDAGFPDRIAWMKAAAEKYPYMDIERVGIFGCSAGGQNAMGALLFHPEFYKVGVAACGCHDNRMDKMWWNEQWMGYPIGPEYAENSNMENAHLLQGKLMLILGELDNNVDPATTLQVVNELIKAKKEFEFIMLPNERHTMGGTYGERKRRDFFVRHLLGHETPDWNND